jgi:predicted ATPase/class 3 adenylate cyclase/DNA-binding CsgD family transcriptional regulator
MSQLPTGTVTLLFTDIEGSTHLLQQLGERYADMLATCRQLLRIAFQQWNGVEVDTQGDAFFVVFARASDAVCAVVEMQRAMARHAWPVGVAVRVRMGMHTGEPQLSSEGYVGLDVHHAARIMSAAHGGQVLLSQTTRDLVEHDLPKGVNLLGLGKYRLKDLEHPSHLYQLVIEGLPADFPPLKTLDASHSNLPVQPTLLIGREKEVAAIQQLLHRQEVRLLTLTGPGGTGKTRLGLQVAAELGNMFFDGVYFVNLAPIRDPEFVLPTIAQALTIRESGAQPLLDLLKTSLHDKQILLLLDNFEQVVSAAIHLVELLAACPLLKIMVTSRMPLHLQAEYEFAVPPLVLPDLGFLPALGALSQYEAVALFISRVQAIIPDFQVTNANAPAVAEICVRLDGLPLAIELAAARMKLFSPQALLARLGQRLQVLTGGAHDLPERQRTLRNTIAWSYHLLSAEEQRLFRRLAAFIAGCTLEAIETISIAFGDPVADVLDGMASLIDKSLVQRITQREEEEPRFVMLETIREYGLEVLAASGETEVTRRICAEYFLQCAEKVARELDGPQQVEWFERLAREYENMRAVLQWSLEPVSAQEIEQRLTLALRLAGALRAFWVMRGHISEGLDFLERALARGEGIVPTSQLARALDQAGGLTRFLGDLDRAEVLLKESLRLRRELADERAIAATLHRLGMVAMARCDFPAARSLTEEALALFREQGNQTRITWALSQLAEIVCEQGDYNEAYALGEECLARNKVQGDTKEVGNSFCQLARVLLLSKGDLEMAHSFFKEGLVLLREVGDSDMSYSLVFAGQVALQRGDLFTAGLLAEESVPMARESGDPENLALALALLGRVNAIQGDLAAARAFYEEGFTIARRVDLKGILASGMEGLASVVVAQGEFVWAARLWGAAEALRETIGTPLPPVYRHDYEQSVAAAHTQLGEQPFVAAWTEGRGMTAEQVFVARGPMAMPTLVSTTQPASPPQAKSPPAYPNGLTAREVEVLRLVAQGLSNAEIAEQLIISLLTVKAHMRSLYNKLGISSRSAATRYAIEHRLV